MRPDDRIRIQHMLEAASTARGSVSNRARMTDEGRTSEPGIPWAAVVGMRNRIVHADFGVHGPPHARHERMDRARVDR